MFAIQYTYVKDRMIIKERVLFGNGSPAWMGGIMYGIKWYENIW